MTFEDLAVETLPLRYCCAAVMVSGRDDRPPYVPPARVDRQKRRDAETGHLWADCPCARCADRRAQGTLPL